MAGDLSNADIHPKTTRIGGISRLEPCKSSTTDHLLIILSGPEPQRSILEKKIIGELKDGAILVRGRPENDRLPETPPGVQVYNHLPAAKLNELICGASMVISRCGYTSVMDLLKLQKNSILIPTPGQAEQEYLAKYLLEKQFAFTVSQDNFSLGQALAQAGTFPFKRLERSMDEYKTHLRRFVQELKQA